MAYPFIKCPTFKELKDKLFADFGCEIKQEGELHKDGGSSLPINYLVRIMEGKVLTYVFHIEDDETVIEVHLLRSICDRLEIPREAFGLTLE